MTTYATTNKFSMIDDDFRKISICPEGYNILSSYNTPGQEYVYCVEKAIFYIRDVGLSLNTVALKSNVRYGWSLYERFKVTNLNSGTNTLVTLFEWSSVLKIDLNTTHLILTTYNIAGVETLLT